MSKELFLEYALERQAIKKKKKESEYAAYLKETTTSKKKRWNVKVGGYRW